MSVVVACLFDVVCSIVSPLFCVCFLRDLVALFVLVWFVVFLRVLLHFLFFAWFSVDVAV